jgi:hypothetical protein
MQTNATLFIRVFKSQEEKEYELNLLLVTDQAKVLLDRAYPLPTLPPGEKSVPINVQSDTAPPSTSVSPLELETPPTEKYPQDPKESVQEAYARRRLALVPRRRIAGGTGFAISGGHLSLGFHTPTVISSDWMIVEGNQPISELHLAQLTDQPKVVKHIQEEIQSMKTLRNIGIGMTLGGFITAGIAFPFLKEGSSEGNTLGGIIAATGTAVGIGGLLLWILYGPAASSAESPYPARHLLKKQEAQQMIESYNDALRREMNPPPATEKSSGNSKSTHLKLSLFPDPSGGASAVFRVVF